MLARNRASATVAFVMTGLVACAASVPEVGRPSADAGVVEDGAGGRKSGGGSLGREEPRTAIGESGSGGAGGAGVAPGGAGGAGGGAGMGSVKVGDAGVNDAAAGSVRVGDAAPFVESTLGEPLDRTGWMLKGIATQDLGALIDGNRNTYWKSQRASVGGEWISIDLGRPATFGKVGLDGGAASHPGPRINGMAINVSDDGKDWGSPVGFSPKSYTMKVAVAVVSFPPQTKRYVKITQTDDNSGSGFPRGEWWDAAEVNLSK
jgi:hypothetical protein